MDLDPLTLSRVQFAFVVSFHIMFPAFTIGLASYIAVLEGLYLRTKKDTYFHLYRFWSRIFAVSFGMGVVSGVVMAYQFGTNWSGLISEGGAVLGPILAYEVLTAFFLEAVFLGIMLFGWGRVPAWVHFAATCCVAVGTVISMFWIIAANSWLQTPAGFFTDTTGALRAANWFQVIFNPSTTVRFAHMALAAYLTTAFVIVGVAARALLRGEDRTEAKTAFAMGMAFIMVVAPAQMIVGHAQGDSMAEHQPAKLAAVEGAWETQRGAPLLLFALPDQDAETNHGEIGIPKLASLIVKGDLDAEIKGLKEFAPQDRPPVWPVFWSFRVMVGVGLMMFATAIVGVALLAMGRLYESKWFQRWCVVMIPSGFLAVETGWFTTEIGRQPWIVNGLLRTEDAMSPIAGGEAAFSLAAFVLVYAAVFGSGLYFLYKIVRGGMRGGPSRPAGDPAPRPMRPLSAADESFDDGLQPAE